MSQNIEQFSLYTAKIFDILYDSFPVAIRLDEREIIAEYLLFDKEDELEKLRIKKDCSELIEDFNNYEELKDLVVYNKSEKNLSDIISSLSTDITLLEIEKDRDKDKQIQIYNGTLTFLLNENLLRKDSHSRFQLTSKSFSHLNKVFKHGSVENSDQTFISACKSIFRKTSSSSVDIAVGTAINIITKYLENSM